EHDMQTTLQRRLLHKVTEVLDAQSSELIFLPTPVSCPLSRRVRHVKGGTSWKLHATASYNSTLTPCTTLSTFARYGAAVAAIKGPENSRAPTSGWDTSCRRTRV